MSRATPYRVYKRVLMVPQFIASFATFEAAKATAVKLDGYVTMRKQVWDTSDTHVKQEEQEEQS